MKRIKCTVSYDGTLFNGYQRQPGQRTVQGEIESALNKICKQSVTIHSSGRTDAGVHAYGQVFHFDSDLSMDGGRYAKALNSILPEDIYVLDSQEVHPDFHSRYHCKVKEYRYKMSLNEYNPLNRHYVYYHRRPLDVERMREAMGYLLGTHDFTSFCGNLDEVNKERTIYKAELLDDEGELTFIFVGNGFLRYMIRIMVGTMIQVGEGRKLPNDIKHILSMKDRRLAGHTAKPQGLYLHRVEYPEEVLVVPSKKIE